MKSGFAVRPLFCHRKHTFSCSLFFCTSAWHRSTSRHVFRRGNQGYPRGASVRDVLHPFLQYPRLPSYPSRVFPPSPPLVSPSSRVHLVFFWIKQRLTTQGFPVPKKIIITGPRRRAHEGRKGEEGHRDLQGFGG